MQLNDIGKNPNNKIKKINQYLESNFGFKISESVDTDNIDFIIEGIQNEIHDLKMKGDVARDSAEISKRLLILEGFKNLKEEYGSVKFYHSSPVFQNVVSQLSNYVVKLFNIGDDVDDAIHQAMKVYRSSKYRFPDDIVEQQVRQNSMNLINNSTTLESAVSGDFNPLAEEKWIHTDPKKRGMFKGKTKAEIDHEISALKKKHASQEGPISDADKTRMHELQFASRAKSEHGLEEADPWGSVGKRASALGGHAATADTPQQQAALKKIGSGGSLSLQDYEPEPKSDEQIPMVKDKFGRMVPDPFAQHAAALRKGIAMKESQNLVKHLRFLLETEVSQAEVMMAAKGFAQELQEMVEKIGRLQNEDLPPVTDQMRETYGTESSSAFQTQIYGALQSVMDALYTAKGQVDDAVTNLAETGQFGATIDMDKEIEPLDGDISLDLDNIGDELGDEPADIDDEFGAAEIEEPLGRSKKIEESLKVKIQEMQRLVNQAEKLRGLK